MKWRRNTVRVAEGPGIGSRRCPVRGRTYFQGCGGHWKPFFACVPSQSGFFDEDRARVLELIDEHAAIIKELRGKVR